MTAMNRAAHVAAELSRDTGYISTTVHIDPTKWSSRRRNIIVGNSYLERFLDIVERGGIPESIPAPEIKSSEQGPFIKKYLKSDAGTIQLRQNLAQKIAQGETLTITVKAR